MPADQANGDKKWSLDQGEKFQPMTARRGRTNTACSIVFIFCVVVLGYILLWAFEHGDPKRLTGLADRSGNICGYSPSFIDKPYLYFCANEVGVLTPTNRVCVSHCPGADQISQTSPVQAPINQACGGTHVYKSTLVAGMYCEPLDPSLGKSLKGAYVDNPEVQLYMRVSEAWKGWPVMLVACFFAVFLAMIWLVLVRDFSQALVWTGFGIVILGSAVLAVFSIHESEIGGYDHIKRTGDSTADFWIGVVLFGISFVLLSIACWGQNSMKVAEPCIQAASICIQDVESLLFQPFLSLFVRLPIFCFLFWGFAHLLSCVALENARAADMLTHGEMKVRIHYSPKEYFFISFYIFMVAWISEFMLALSHFVIAYATEVWFFTPPKQGGRSKDTPPFLTCAAHADAMKYHIGTLAMGSFIIMFVRVPRTLARCLSTAQAESANCMSETIGCACSLVLKVYEMGLKVLTKEAWMDVAMNGNNFCQAAEHSLQVLEFEGTTAITMHGACWMLQWAGASFITFFGGILTFIICVTCPWFNMESSEYFVEDPLELCILSAFCSNVVALPFVMLFNDVSDTILFAFALEAKRSGAKNSIVKFVEGVWCARTQEDPLAKVEKRLEQPPEAQALLDKVKKEEAKKEKEKGKDRGCMEKTRACGH